MRPTGEVKQSAPRPATIPTAQPGLELVLYSEQVYRSMFMIGLIVVAISAIGSLLFLPLRGGASPIALLTSTALLCAAGLAVARAPEIYRAVLQYPQLEVLPTGLAAALLTAAPIVSSSFWWCACALLMAMAAIVPPRRAMTYCFAVLLTNLAGHIVRGDLGDTEPVAVIGLWVGLPFWTFVFGYASTVIVRHVLWLRDVVANEDPSGVRVIRVENLARGRNPPRPYNPSDSPPEGAKDIDVTPISRLGDQLTTRQAQVVALLAEGLRYAEIARSLSITERQVQRHVAAAVQRSEVRTASELVALIASGKR